MANKTNPDIAAVLHRQHDDRLTWLDRADGALLPFQSGYPNGYRVPDHHHRRCQFMQALSGILLVATPQGRWIVPPGNAMWVPGGIEHSVEMLGNVTMRSVYVEPDAHPDFPAGLTVLGVTPLMDHLLAEALVLESDVEVTGRNGHLIALLLHEIPRLPVRPLNLPMPADTRLVTLCRQFLAAPSARLTIDEWAEQSHMSRRTFTRTFQQETGLSLAIWRQQAHVFAALPRLSDGESVTSVALDLGYDSVPAFTTMFKRMLGAAPRDYMRNVRERA